MGTCQHFEMVWYFAFGDPIDLPFLQFCEKGKAAIYFESNELTQWR